MAIMPPNCLSAHRARPNERDVIPECVVTRTTRQQTVSELPAGAGCQEKENLPAEEVKCFLLTSPFIEPAEYLELRSANMAGPLIGILSALLGFNYVDDSRQTIDRKIKFPVVVWLLGKGSCLFVEPGCEYVLSLRLCSALPPRCGSEDRDALGATCYRLPSFSDRRV